MRRLGRWAARLLLAGLAVWAATTAAVIWLSVEAMEAHAGGRAIETPVDAAVVLGAGLEPDGVIGYGGRQRVATAVEVFEVGKARALIMAGGSTSEWVTASEAERMRAYAVALGVPAERVLIEERSSNTLENLLRSFALAESQGMERLALVSDPFHLPRAGALARYLGRGDIELVAAAGWARQSWPARILLSLREALAWWVNAARVAIMAATDATAGQRGTGEAGLA